jgi:hypothetical protein
MPNSGEIMRIVIRLLIWIIVALLVYKVGLWAYEEYQPRLKSGPRSGRQEEIHDSDKVCKVIADTGQCVCRHRRTNDRLSLPYEECISRAR